MSFWTYVNGVVEVSTLGRTDAETLFLATQVANHLPRIIGSERGTNIYINIPNGYNWSSSCDEYGADSNLYNDRRLKCFNHQTHALLTFNGKLQDKMFDDTLRETTKMLTRLSKRLNITAITLSVRDDMGNEFIFNDDHFLLTNYKYYSE